MIRIWLLKISISVVMLTGRSFGNGNLAIILKDSVLPVLTMARATTSGMRFNLLDNQSRRDLSSVCRFELVC